MRVLNQPSLTVLFCALCARHLPGQQIDAAMHQRLDQLVQQCIQEDGAPSAAVAIVADGRVAYVSALGHASLSPAVAASPATRYQLASLSKTFTAQAVLLLVSEGKLTLDDPISRWYPDVTEATHITVRQLLSHTAGLPDHYPESYPAGPRTSATTPDKIIAEWGHHPLLTPPGTRFRYSNLDYEIAGRIVEKVSGRPLFAFLQERIFAPLKMTSVVDLDTLPPGSDALATGYVRDALAPLSPAPYEGPGWSFGAGQVVATAEDVARWDHAFLEHQVLPPAQARDEVTRVPLSDGTTAPTGLGLFVGSRDGVTRYYHSGQGLGFTAINIIYPEARLALVVLSNTSATGTAGKIADRITYLLLPPTGNEKFARGVFACLQHGEVDPATFGADLKAYLTSERLAAYRSSLASLGPVQSFVAGSEQTADGLQSRDYDVVAGGHRLKLHLLVLPNGLLEEASIADGQNR